MCGSNVGVGELCVEEDMICKDGNDSEEEDLTNQDSSIEGKDGSTGEGEGGDKLKKMKIQGLYKPPTHDELQTLRDTQNLFKSNLMKLQVSSPFPC